LLPAGRGAKGEPWCGSQGTTGKSLRFGGIESSPSAATIGGGAIDCTIRNRSAIGAALDVTSPEGIPAHFTLFVPADGRHWPCRVVSRKEKRIGVAFE
jgi:hypothetical protein